MNNLIYTLKRAFTVPRQLSILLIVGAIPFTVAEGMLYEAFHDIPQSQLSGIGAATLLVALWKTARGSAGWRTFSWILWWIRVASLTFGAYPIFGSQPEWVPSGMATFFALFMAFIILCSTGYMCLWFRLNRITKPRPFLEAKLAPSSAVEKKPRDAERSPVVGREQHKVVQSLCQYCRSEYFPGEVRCRSCSAPLGSVRSNGREHPTVSLDANTSETRLPALDSRTAGPDHHVSSFPKTALIVSGLGVLAVVLVSVLMPPPSRDNRHAATGSSTFTASGAKLTPEQRLARLRARHEIIPAGAATVTAPDGTPTLVIDVQVFNKGTESLNRLTVLVRVRGGNGADRVAQRATLDLTGVRPGVGERRSVMIPGVALAETDEISVELEANLPAEVLRQLPEWSATVP